MTKFDDERAADDEKAESDVESDSKVAGARPGKHGEDDGSYVGRSSSDDDFGSGDTGAGAKSVNSAADTQ